MPSDEGGDKPKAVRRPFASRFAAAAKSASIRAQPDVVLAHAAVLSPTEDQLLERLRETLWGTARAAGSIGSLEPLVMTLLRIPATPLLALAGIPPLPVPRKGAITAPDRFRMPLPIPPVRPGPCGSTSKQELGDPASISPGSIPALSDYPTAYSTALRLRAADASLASMVRAELRRPLALAGVLSRYAWVLRFSPRSVRRAISVRQ